MVPKADLLNGQIVFEEGYFFRQRDLLPVFRRQRRAEKIAQVLDHASRKFWVPFQLRRNGVQRVKKKMRIQLHPKRIQTSLGEAFFQALKTQLTGKVVIVVAVCLPGPQDQPVYKPVPKKQASQRVEEKPDTEHAIPFSNPEG